MKPSFHIRDLKAEDFRRFVELHEEIDRFHRDALPQYFRRPDQSFRSFEVFSGWLNDPSTALFGAIVDENLVGLVCIFLKKIEKIAILVDRTFGLLDVLVVSPDMRGSGIGAALVQAAQDWAKNKGATQIEINVWNSITRQWLFMKN